MMRKILVNSLTFKKKMKINKAKKIKVEHDDNSKKFYVS